ncbi:MAG: hypothetical protein ACP5QA_04770 [Phycisphaerae bacterium]
MPQLDHQKQGPEAPLKAILGQQLARESQNYVLNKTPDSPFINLYRPGIPNRADTGIGIPDRHKSSLHIQPEDCFISSKGRFLRNLASRVNPTSCAGFLRDFHQLPREADSISPTKTNINVLLKIGQQIIKKPWLSRRLARFH